MSEIEELKSQVAELRNTVNSMTALLQNQDGMQIFPKTLMSALYNDDGTKYRLVKQISWAEYQALEQAGKVSATTIYDITDRPFVAMASMIGFNKSGTSLSSTTVQGALSEIDNSLSNNVYTKNGLAFSNCSYIAGGYTKIGNLVIVDLRVMSNSVSVLQIDGFPSYSNKTISGKGIVPCQGYNMTDETIDIAYAAINQSGTCLVRGSLKSSKEYAINCVYLCN